MGGKMPRRRRAGVESIPAIAAVYSATRADNGTLLNVTLALLGAGAAYLVGTLAFVDKFGTSISWFLVAALPVPLWIIAIFHSILTVSAMTNSLALRAFERELMQASFADRGTIKGLGYANADRIMNIRIARWPHRVATAVVYGGVGATIILYTIYLILLSRSRIGLWTWAFVALYLALLVIAIASWIAGFAHLDATSKILQL
jgi:hypothetical protein